MTDQAFKSDFLRTMQARGYIHQITHPTELDAAAAEGVVTGYIGFDATAPSLHVGHLFGVFVGEVLALVLFAAFWVLQSVQYWRVDDPAIRAQV